MTLINVLPISFLLRPLVEALNSLDDIGHLCMAEPLSEKCQKSSFSHSPNRSILLDRTKLNDIEVQNCRHCPWCRQ